ncbi:hypothetical protein Fcan01_21006 [Folsomia candida]|uniref:Retrotransposon gag domain-containing protein n=1 Tax=Folsomia candida TaxID=158441 RepID=A0A226DIZ6_FOLCA|nr:hypothetical protein Fcan01_21006 [Folsomia candida]
MPDSPPPIVAPPQAAIIPHSPPPIVPPPPVAQPPPPQQPPMAQQIPPNPPQVGNMNPLKLVKYFRKYDGKSDSVEFLHRLSADLIEYQISAEWIVNNFDRVLEGEASAWFSSIWPSYSARISQNPHLQYGYFWAEICDEFTEFFDHKSLLNAHKQENRQLRYTEKTDPQAYVTQKLRLLRNIDPDMSESRKVEQLIKGLPIPLQIQLAAVPIRTPHALLEQLRKIEELLGRHRLNIPRAFSMDGSSITMLASTNKNKGESRPQQNHHTHRNNANQGNNQRSPCRYHKNCYTHTSEQCRVLNGNVSSSPSNQDQRNNRPHNNEHPNNNNQRPYNNGNNYNNRNYNNRNNNYNNRGTQPNNFSGNTQQQQQYNGNQAQPQQYRSQPWSNNQPTNNQQQYQSWSDGNNANPNNMQVFSQHPPNNRGLQGLFENSSSSQNHDSEN